MRTPSTRHRSKHSSGPAPTAFPDKTQAPPEAEVAVVLGKAYAAWQKLLTMFREQFPGGKPIWKYTSKTTGWGLRLVVGDRVIVYMSPQPKQFLVSFALGERAVAAARSASLPPTMWMVIQTAPRYAEGRGVRLVVRNSAPLAGLVRLARIKFEN